MNKSMTVASAIVTGGGFVSSIYGYMGGIIPSTAVMVVGIVIATIGAMCLLVAVKTTPQG